MGEPTVGEGSYVAGAEFLEVDAEWAVVRRGDGDCPGGVADAHRQTGEVWAAGFVVGQGGVVDERAGEAEQQRSGFGAGIGADRRQTDLDGNSHTTDGIAEPVWGWGEGWVGSLVDKGTGGLGGGV